MPKLPPAPKGVRQKPVIVRQQVALVLPCEWSECTEVYSDMKSFVNHVTSHLQDVMNFVRSFHQTEISSASLQCMWRECGHEIGEDFLELMRHVYFHAFHTKIKSIGQTFSEQRNLTVCALETSGRNIIPGLPERMVCSWKDCMIQFDDPNDFYNHTSKHQEQFPDGNFVQGGCKCGWIGCESTVKSRYKLREHLRSHTQEKIVACPTCGGLFSSFTKFVDHINRQQIAESGFQCSHCSKNFPNERLLRDHMRSHVNHYKCPFCDMTCPNPSAVRTHIKYRHSEERTFPCSSCDFAGKSQSDLRRHMDSHNDNEYFCHMEDCDFNCRTYIALSKHFREKHQGIKEVPRHACHLCGKLFLRGERLTLHLKTVHNFKWPSGHRRFRYKENDDGFLRLQTIRYESIELTEEIMANKGRGKKSAKEDQQMTPPVGRTKRSTRSDKSNESSENTPSKTPKADEEDQTQESVSAVTTVKVSRTPLVIQGSKPKTIQGVQRTQEHINEAMNRSKRKTTGENEGSNKRLRKGTKTSGQQQKKSPKVTNSRKVLQNAPINRKTSGRERRNLTSAFEDVTEQACDSDCSTVSSRLVIDQDRDTPKGKNTSRKRTAKKRTPKAKATKETAKKKQQGNVKSPSAEPAYSRVNRRKSESPQKRIQTVSADDVCLDMPIIFTSPPRPVRPAPSNSAVHGSQRRKLQSPTKKCINVQNAVNQLIVQNTNTTADASTENIMENVIHIYPHDEGQSYGLQVDNVPQPVFIANLSPSRLAAEKDSDATYSVLRVAALASGVIDEEEGDLEAAARLLGIDVQSEPQDC